MAKYQIGDKLKAGWVIAVDEAGEASVICSFNDQDTDADYGRAESVCSQSQEGGHTNWRLPTIEELETMYKLHTKKNRNFNYQSYWSSSVDIHERMLSNTGGQMEQVINRKIMNFNNGEIIKFMAPTSGKYRVRAVRNMKEE